MWITDESQLLLQLLRETATKQVEANQPCLERTARVLQAFVADELPDLLGELPTESNASTIIAENLPSPRITGAAFDPVGMRPIVSVTLQLEILSVCLHCRQN